MSITFQKLPGPVYPAYLVVDDYSIALEPELVQSLKEIESSENNVFIESIVRQVGINRYLRDMIQDKIDSAENIPALVLSLRNSLKNL